MHISTAVIILGALVAISAVDAKRGRGCFGHADGDTWQSEEGCMSCRCVRVFHVCDECQDKDQPGGDLSLPFPKCCPNYSKNIVALPPAIAPF